MGSNNALWYKIVDTFAEVDRLCTEALAAELGVKRGGAEERAVRSIIGEERGDIEAGAAPSPERRLFPRAADLAKDLAFREAHPDGADIVKMRDGMRRTLIALHKELSRALAERDVYPILIPIVIYCDELANSVTRGGVKRWELLQSEMFNFGDGGERFYRFIDEHVLDDRTHPLVFEVYYFCLNDGFKGMHRGDEGRIEDYERKLREKIRLQPVRGGETKERAKVKVAAFPWKYYAVAAGVTLAVYLLLRWYAAFFS